MKRKLFHSCFRAVKKLSLLILSILISTVFIGCAYRTYTGSTENFTFSFEYSKKDLIYPYSLQYMRHPQPMPPKLSGGTNPVALISIATFHNLTETHIDGFITHLKTEEGIIYYTVGERGAVELDKITADYVRYGYDSYDTITVSYEGIFISFLYIRRSY